MIKRKSVLHATLAFAAALCGYLSSASAVTNRWLDTNPGTPNQDYYGGVTDFQSGGSDYATANMFIGNWGGWQVAMIDVTGAYWAAPQSKYQMVLQCSGAGNQGTGLVSIPAPVWGAEHTLYCPGSSIATQSTQAILYQ